MEPPRFIKNNESFICIECGENVSPHPSSSRDHCNHCLTGLHVDINPGDRMNECAGGLKPIGLQTKSGKTQIAYRCERCGAQVFNIIAPDDNQEIIAALYQMPW